MHSKIEQFIIHYIPSRIGEEKHFVPAYASHRPASQKVLSGAYYEPETHRLINSIFQVIPGNLIHAGTFFGDMLPSFARSVGGGRVFAFEPVLENYILARLATEANCLSNVVLFNAALGEEVGTAYIATVDGEGRHHGGGSHIAAQGRPCTMLTLDGLSIPDISVIQLDIEGCETLALRGAGGILTSQKPVVLVEDNRRDCEATMNRFRYVRVGSIPGLHIYLPSDKEAPARKILDIL